MRYATPRTHLLIESNSSGSQLQSGLFVGILALALLFSPAKLGAETKLAPRPVDTKLEAKFEFAMAQLQADAGNFEQAMAGYQKALDLDGSDAFSYAAVAKFYSELATMTRARQQQLGYLDVAVGYLEDARRLAPANADILLLYGQTHLRLVEQRPSSLDLAQGALEELRAVQPEDLTALTSLGQIYHWKREYEKAADAFGDAINSSPRNRMIQNLLVDSLIRAGDRKAAAPALEQLIALEPETTDNYLQLAELLSDLGDHQRATEILQQAPPEVLQDPQARRLLAREYQLAGQPKKSLELTSEWQGRRQAPGFHRLRVAAFNDLARYSEAIQELEPLLKEENDAALKLRDVALLSRLYERVGRSAEAVALLQAQIAKMDETYRPQLELALAGVLERAGDTAAAVNSLKPALDRAKPEEVPVYAQAIADLLGRAGQIEAAGELLEATVARLRDSDSGAAEALGLRRLLLLAEADRWQDLAERTAPMLQAEDDLALAARQLHAEALAGLDQLPAATALLAEKEAEKPLLRVKRLQLMFDHGMAEEAALELQQVASTKTLEDLFFAAQMFQRQQQFEPAIPLLEQILEAQPEEQQSLFMLASAYERAGNREKSIATFERILAQAPNHAPTLNYLGYMWAEGGERLEEALEMIVKALSIDPDNGAYVDSLGWVYFRLGQYPKARQHLEWAAHLVPGDPTIYDHLGDLYKEVGEPERALKAYEKALELEIEDPDQVRQKMKALETPGS